MAMGIGGIYPDMAYKNRTVEEQKTRQAETEETKGTSFSDNVLTCTSVGGKKAMLCQDALFSMASFVTGESVNVYKAEGFSETNPVYLVKGIDSKGNEYEKTINADEVNPNSCSFLELSVLNVHAGKSGKDSFMQMAMVHARVGEGEESFFRKADYNQAVTDTLKEYQTMKAWDSYLKCSSWWQGIMDYFMSK